MKFFNKQNEQISFVEWKRLSRDHAYCTLRVSEDWYYKITTTWLGVQLECEDTPTIFVLSKRLLHVDQGKKPKDWLRPEWFTTESAAIARHREIEPADSVCFV